MDLVRVINNKTAFPKTKVSNFIIPVKSPQPTPEGPVAASTALPAVKVVGRDSGYMSPVGP